MRFLSFLKYTTPGNIARKTALFPQEKCRLQFRFISVQTISGTEIVFHSSGAGYVSMIIVAI